MHRYCKLISCTFSLVGFLFMAGMARAEILEFTTTLDEAQENLCAGTGSTATGSGIFTLDTATGLVNYEITVTGLSSTEILAFVHHPAPECTKVVGGYQLPLGSPKVGSVTLSASEQADMINGLHYTNIHTNNFGGGEIRGQIYLVVPAPAVSEWGLAIMTVVVLAAGTIMLRRRRRLV